MEKSEEFNHSHRVISAFEALKSNGKALLSNSNLTEDEVSAGLTDIITELRTVDNCLTMELESWDSRVAMEKRKLEMQKFRNSQLEAEKRELVVEKSATDEELCVLRQKIIDLDLLKMSMIVEQEDRILSFIQLITTAKDEFGAEKCATKCEELHQQIAIGNSAIDCVLSECVRLRIKQNEMMKNNLEKTLSAMHELMTKLANEKDRMKADVEMLEEELSKLDKKLSGLVLSGDEFSSDETSDDETPSDKIPSDETPSDKIPSDKIPSDETPSDEIPSDETPSDKIPSDQTPSDKTPSDKIPSDETPSDKIPSDETPSDE